MKVVEFFELLIPAAGWHYVAHPRPYTDKTGKPRIGWSHRAATDLSDLALLARQIHNEGKDTYFALANFEQERHFDEDKGYYRTRTGENASHLQAFWLDIDCGSGKESKTQKDAYTALRKACTKTGLDLPQIVVSSGNGLHVYWPLTRPIHKDIWRPAARALEAALDWAGFRPDPSRTKDVVSILRVPGSLNYKDPNSPKLVKVLDSASPGGKIDDRVFRTRLGELIREHSIKPKKSYKKTDNGDLGANLNQLYRPCNPDKMANRCAVFGSMRDTQGAEQDEPLWYATLGVLVQETVIDGEQTAHQWSSGYPAYNESDCQAKLDQANQVGPTTCEKFREITSLCEGCELKCKSPIQLGQEIHHTEEIADCKIPPMYPGMKDYAFDPARGGLFKNTEDGVIPICASYPRIIDIFQDAEGEHQARIETLVRTSPECVFEQADIRVGALSAGGTQMLSALGAKAGIVSQNDKELSSYMKTWYELMREGQALGALHRQMGWQEDGSFLLGFELISRQDDGTIAVRQAPLSKALANYASAHRPVGNLEENIRLIDALYNRPHHETYQFALLASLGSALIPLIHADWVGIPMSLWSPVSGGGKTTVCKFGISFWGDPKGSGQAAYSEGATEYAIYVMAGERHHLPTLIDETTNWTAERASRFLYQYASGLAKIQGKADGGLRDNTNLNWQNILYTTANRSMMSTMMASLASSAPMAMRIFEIRVPKIDLDPSDRALIRQLEKHHGLVGREFIKYVVKHKGKVEAALEGAMGKLDEVDSATDARYWKMVAACTLVAGGIAKKLGLIDFDMTALARFAKQQIRRLRSTVSESHEDPESRFARLVSELTPQILVTNHDNRPCVIDHHYSAPRFKDIVGRYLTDTGELYLSIKAIRRWCDAEGADYQIVREWVENNMDVATNERYAFTKATAFKGVPRHRCWKIVMPLEEFDEATTQTNVTDIEEYKNAKRTGA